MLVLHRYPTLFILLPAEGQWGPLSCRSLRVGRHMQLGPKDTGFQDQEAGFSAALPRLRECSVFLSGSRFPQVTDILKADLWAEKAEERDSGPSAPLPVSGWTLSFPPPSKPTLQGCSLVTVETKQHKGSEEENHLSSGPSFLSQMTEVLLVLLMRCLLST